MCHMGSSHLERSARLTGREGLGRERVLMRILVGTIVFLGALALFALAAHAQEIDPYQWVGVTSVSYDGDDGFVEMTTRCRADFGHGARMCKSSEILDSDTLDLNTIPVNECWVRPAFQPVVRETQLEFSIHVGR
jgi:hypothetical protein